MWSTLSNIWLSKCVHANKSTVPIHLFNIKEDGLLTEPNLCMICLWRLLLIQVMIDIVFSYGQQDFFLVMISYVTSLTLLLEARGHIFSQKPRKIISSDIKARWTSSPKVTYMAWTTVGPVLMCIVSMNEDDKLTRHFNRHISPNSHTSPLFTGYYRPP